MSANKDTSAPLARLDAAMVALERMPEGPMRQLVADALRAVLDLHGEALGKILEQVRARPEADPLLHLLAADESIAQVLLLHGLHPLELEARLALALEALQDYLRLHLARLELLAVSESGVRLQLTVSGVGCGSTATKIRARVEEAIAATAPEVAVELVEITAAAQPVAGFVSLSRLQPHAEKSA